MNPTASSSSPEVSERDDDLLGRLARTISKAARFEGDPSGLDEGERAALARLDPDAEPRPHQIAALTRALLRAGLEPAHWRPSTWRRWGLIAHGMALAGHDPKHSLGWQLHQAKVAESRVTKLLTARGDAFRQLLPRLLRLMASQEVAPNWYQLGGLILSQDRDEVAAEQLRLRIASAYYSAERQRSESTD